MKFCTATNSTQRILMAKKRISKELNDAENNPTYGVVLVCPNM